MRHKDWAVFTWTGILLAILTFLPLPIMAVLGGVLAGGGLIAFATFHTIAWIEQEHNDARNKRLAAERNKNK